MSDVATSEGLDWATARGMGALAEKMGMEFVEFSVDRCVATMPVEGNTQPVGLMHGGAYVVLGESSIDGGQSARRCRTARRRRRHQRDAHAFGDVGRRHRCLHPCPPGTQHHRARDRGDRRSGATLLHDPHHQHDQGPSCRALSGSSSSRWKSRWSCHSPRCGGTSAPSRCARSRFLAARSGSRGCAPVWPPAADGVPVPCASTR